MNDTIGKLILDLYKISKTLKSIILTHISQLIFMAVFWSLKGTVARDFDADFFIPIDRHDLGDGPLGVKTSVDVRAQRNERFTYVHFRYKCSI